MWITSDSICQFIFEVFFLYQAQIGFTHFWLQKFGFFILIMC